MRLRGIAPSRNLRKSATLSLISFGSAWLSRRKLVSLLHRGSLLRTPWLRLSTDLATAVDERVVVVAAGGDFDDCSLVGCHVGGGCEKRDTWECRCAMRDADAVGVRDAQEQGYKTAKRRRDEEMRGVGETEEDGRERRKSPQSRLKRLVVVTGIIFKVKRCWEEESESIKATRSNLDKQNEDCSALQGSSSAHFEA